MDTFQAGVDGLIETFLPEIDCDPKACVTVRTKEGDAGWMGEVPDFSRTLSG